MKSETAASGRLSRIADLVAARSHERWGERRRTMIIGRHSRLRELRSVPLVGAQPETLLGRLLAGEGTFWELVHEPFLERDLNRDQVRDLVASGLRQSGGSYKRLLALFGIAQEDYLKFMDFLRHHRLKPTHWRSGS